MQQMKHAGILNSYHGNFKNRKLAKIFQKGIWEKRALGLLKMLETLRKITICVRASVMGFLFGIMIALLIYIQNINFKNELEVSNFFHF